MFLRLETKLIIVNDFVYISLNTVSSRRLLCAWWQ